MKNIKNTVLLSTAVIAIGLGAAACKSTAAQRDAAGAEVAEKAAKLKGVPGTNVQLTETIVNGKPYRKYTTRYIDENGALVDETFEQQLDGTWTHMKKVKDGRSRVYQPSITQIYNDTPVFDQEINMQKGIKVSEGILILPQEDFQQTRVVRPASQGQGRNIVIIKNAEKQPVKE